MVILTVAKKQNATITILDLRFWVWEWECLVIGLGGRMHSGGIVSLPSWVSLNQIVEIEYP